MGQPVWWCDDAVELRSVALKENNPTLATMKLSRTWGTPLHGYSNPSISWICGGDYGVQNFLFQKGSLDSRAAPNRKSRPRQRTPGTMGHRASAPSMQAANN